MFYYLMKLHYSQTVDMLLSHREEVLLPYEITLLSNKLEQLKIIKGVLLPYEITLLSNFLQMELNAPYVLLPYEITLQL